MKNKKLLFIGVLTAFLMLAVPFAVVSFDSGDSYAAPTTVDDDESLNEAINKGNPSSVDVMLAEGDYKEIEVSIDHSEAIYENVSDDEFTDVRVYSREISSIIIDGSESSSVSGFIFKVGFRTVYKNADGSGGLDYYCFNKFKVGNLTIRNITLNQSDIVSLDNNQYGVPLEIGKIFFENVTFDVESSDGAISHTIIGNNTVIGSIEYDGCNFIGNTEYSTQNGILVDSRSPNEVNITVKDCTFNNIGYNAVQISGTGSNYAGNISLMGNTVDTTGDRAFRISWVSDASKINIYNNTLIRCEDDLSSAFKVEAGKGNIQSSGNTLNGQPFGIIEADIGDIGSPKYLYNNSIDDILTEIENINSISFNSDYFTSDLITIEASKDISIIGKPECLLNGLKIDGNNNKVTISGINSVSAGILVQNAGSVEITGCNVSGITNETTIPGINGMFGGIGVQNATSVEIISNVVRDNAYLTYKGATKEVNGAGNGIVVSDISEYVIVSGNTVDTVAYTAMYADNVDGSVTISGNTFEEWNSVNIHDGGRGIRATVVGSIDVNNNDFIKDYSTISMNDIGNLFKVDGFESEGTVSFSENRINGKTISIDETITADDDCGFFFDADVSFDADSESVVSIEEGFYYWSDVTITGECHFPVQDDEKAFIKVYGDLIIEKDASLRVNEITMSDGSKLDNKGTLVVGVIYNPQNSDVIFRAGSHVTYGENEQPAVRDYDVRLINSDGTVKSSVDSETEKFVSEGDVAEIDIGSQSSVTVEDELTVDLAVDNDGNAKYTVLFPAGTVILKGAEVSIEEVSSESDMPMAMFEVHFKDIDTKGDIIQITLPTSGISNPYVFFVDDGEYVLMETVGEPGEMITFETTHNSKYAVISGDIASDFGFPEEDVSDGLDVNIIYIVELVLIALALLGLAAIIRRN